MPHVLLVFKKACQTSIESIVRWCAGPMIHVDIIPGDKRSAYTSYMFENFSENALEGYSALTHVCLRFDVTQQEHDAAQAILESWVRRSVPYNYADIFRCILPGESCASERLDPETVSSLFCSQAVTLALQHALDAESTLGKAMAALPNRFTTPTMLYDAVSPHSALEESIFDL
jgi:hypothetical protein